MEIIIAVANRGNKTVEHHRFSGEQCHIGRAYDNDIIINEPHVCPNHAVIEEDAQGQLWLRDVGSINGIRGHRYHKMGQLSEIHSGDEFQIGRAKFHVYRSDHPVEETLELGFSDSALHFFSRPVPFLSQLIFLFASLFILEYNRYFEALEWREFLPLLLVVPFMAFIWSAIWAITGRLSSRHEPRFLSQCVITVFYITIIEWLDPILENVAFNTGDVEQTRMLSYIVHGIMFYILLTMNLRLSTHLSDMVRRVSAISVVLVTLGLVWLVSFFTAEDNYLVPQYVSDLQPPNLRWSESHDLDHFLTASDRIFAQPSELAANKGDEVLISSNDSLKDAESELTKSPVKQPEDTKVLTNGNGVK